MQQCSLSLKNQKKQLLFEIFNYGTYIKMETKKIVNLLNDTDNESSNWATKNDMSLMINVTQNMVKEMKIIQALNLRLKLLNQLFMII